MTSHQRRVSELATAISELMEDYTAEVYWENLRMYNLDETKLKLPMEHLGSLAVWRSHMNESVGQVAKNQIGHHMQVIRLIEVFFRMGDVSLEMRPVWARVICGMYMDVLKIQLSELNSKEDDIVEMIRLYRSNRELSEEVDELFDAALEIYGKLSGPLKADGRFTRFGIRQVNRLGRLTQALLQG